MQGNRLFGLTAVVAIAVMLQVMFVFADCHNAPGDVAGKFTKAYFGLDPAMAGLLCTELAADETLDPVAAHLRRMETEAEASGHTPAYMRSHLTHLHTHTTIIDENRAEVVVSGERKRNINPVFTLVGRWFSLGETYPMDHSLELVKEDGEWKVCGNPFSTIG